MSLEPAVELAQCDQLRRGQVAALRKHGIQARCGVPLRQDKAVALRPVGMLGVVSHIVAVEGYQQLGRGELRGRVPAASGSGPSDYIAPHVAGMVGQARKSGLVSDCHQWFTGVYHGETCQA